MCEEGSIAFTLSAFSQHMGKRLRYEKGWTINEPDRLTGSVSTKNLTPDWDVVFSSTAGHIF